MNVYEINLLNYNLTVLAYSEYNDASMIPAQQFTMKFGAVSNPNMERLIKDMMVMNEVRGQLSNPSVQDAYEQLLTVLALTNPGIDKK